jgi:hypothetical protein
MAYLLVDLLDRSNKAKTYSFDDYHNVTKQEQFHNQMLLQVLTINLSSQSHQYQQMLIFVHFRIYLKWN